MDRIRQAVLGGQSGLLEATKAPDFQVTPYKLNLIGYMLANMVIQSNDGLVEDMLQTVLQSLTETEASSEEEGAAPAEDEKMLVFSDKSGQVWQIKRVDADTELDFGALISSAEAGEDFNAFQPQSTLQETELKNRLQAEAQALLDEEDGVRTYRLNSVRCADQPALGMNAT